MKYKAINGIMLTLLLIGILTLTFNIQPAKATLQPPWGMVSYWKLDEDSGTTAYDSVGDNNGTLVNGPTWTTGQVDGALSFDGVDDYVDYGDIPEANFGTGPFTVEFWMKRDSFNQYAQYVSKSRYAQGGWTFHDDSSHFALYIGEGAENAVASPVGSIQNGIWYHIAGTRNESGLVKLYINGTEVANRTITYNANSTNSLLLGKRSGSSYIDYFDGIIDEVAIYNRALTPEEIQQHYNNGLRGMGYWNLVGGISIPVNKLSLLAPYIALVSTIIIAISVSVAYIKYKKKQ